MYWQKPSTSVLNVLDWGDLDGKNSSKDKGSYAYKKKMDSTLHCPSL